MVNITTKYIVYTHGGSGVRHHHFGPQNNIIDEADSTATAGDLIPALGIPSLLFNGEPVAFAFMSVHGAADGNHLFTAPGNQSVHVGTSNVDILVVYAPPAGGGNGGPGVFVDAFNVDAGAFSDSDFIQVLTPPTPPTTVDTAKSSEANAEGDVPTATAENVRAFGTVDGAPFLQWQRISPTTSTTATPDVSFAQNESGEIWFAFYQTPTSAPNTGVLNVRRVLLEALGTWEKDDYCGTPVPHHIGPGGPVFGLNINEVGLNAAQQKKIQSLAREYPAIAKTAYLETMKVTEILQNVGEVIANVKSAAD